MKQPSLQAISPETYQQLRAWASLEPDFVHLGSHGTGPGRGRWQAFSARATGHYPSTREDSPATAARDVAQAMEALVANYRLAPASPGPNVPMGGLVGFLGYEYGYLKEPRLAPLCPDLPVATLHAGLFLWMASRNQSTGQHYLWLHPACPDDLRRQIRCWLEQPAPEETRHWRMTAPFRARQTAAEFKQSVRAVKDYIRAGDCYQANLSQEFTGRYQGDPWLAYQGLAEANPTPYSAYLRAGERAVLSVSPERFLEIEGRTVRTSPIKGTRPRGSSPQEDHALAQALLDSEKDRAENLMIVDLLRNDLGLNARTGSVTVEQLFALESYRNVHHLVSHIRAELADGVSPLQTLLDAFPGGSITGAPKVRAMEIIRELEPHWRGPYCGSVFHYRFDGHLDSSIAIRTLLCDGQGRIHCWGGGGIVEDSDPDAEYQETLTKVGPLMRFLEGFTAGRAGT
ncbi:aminodeoxychorismate synthase component I [uncultured Marinobacter sp.]|uniref:aminodeoxychorismate synthase component I n=1 Tax=uncultured Marinobacter sp. TaxID=187379 RepID=UPI0032B12AAD